MKRFSARAIIAEDFFAEKDPDPVTPLAKPVETRAPAAPSRKRLKESRRRLISRLKELSDRPDLIDMWDITAPNPLLLVHLKSVSFSVPVPSNWRQKRKYLQNKRGMEKRAYQLPAYIAETGVGELRDAQIAAEEKKSLKQRQRERMRAKTGRGVEIDHARLHDAFFKFQTKPRLSQHGDVYYELKELQVDTSTFAPGVLSDQLLAALGIQAYDPPPWLINMQRYGPPPGYVGLSVAGVNAPIPQGARFGYHRGGWGKVPVDEQGSPVYGDVFGEGTQPGGGLWGEEEAAAVVEVHVKDEDDEEEEEDEVESKVVDQEVIAAEASRRVEQRGRGKAAEGGALYEVLEKRSVAVSGAMMGSSHVYDIEGEGKRKREEEKQDEEVPAGRPSKKQRQFKF